MIEGKTIVITGAANGIGRAWAEMFFADGAKVIACDKDEEKLLESVSYTNLRAHET